MKISVCLASYNGEKYIQEQIQSILNCLSDDDELIISDDGSTDSTVKLVESYSAKNISLFHNEEVMGVVGNFKNAVKHSKGEIIVLSDQDDAWLPNRLENLTKLHENHSVVMSNGQFVEQNLKLKLNTIFDVYKQTHNPLKIFYKNNFVGCSMSFTKAYQNKFLALPSYAPMHDWVIGFYASIKKDIYFDEEVRFLFRRHDSNASSTGNQSDRSFWKKCKDRYLLLKSTYHILKLP